MVGQFDGLFAGEVFDIEAEEQDAVEGFVDFVLQAGLVVGGVSASQQAQGLDLVVGVFQYADAAEGDHTPEMGGELVGLDVVAVDDAE